MQEQPHIMKKTFLLQEVIDDLVNVDRSLSSALIRLNYFGKLIKNDELINYTQKNLDRIKGYNSVNLRLGYQMIEIRSPKDLINYGDD